MSVSCSIATVIRRQIHQNRAVDADRVHGCHHLVAGNLRRPSESAHPRTARVVVFVGVHLSIDRQHPRHLSAISLTKPTLLIGRLC